MFVFFLVQYLYLSRHFTHFLHLNFHFSYYLKNQIFLSHLPFYYLPVSRFIRHLFLFILYIIHNFILDLPISPNLLILLFSYCFLNNRQVFCLFIILFIILVITLFNTLVIILVIILLITLVIILFVIPHINSIAFIPNLSLIQ